MEELLEQIRVVVEARELVRKLKNEKRDLLERWEQNNKELLYQIDLQGAWLADEETELRDRTLKAYAETGNKAPAVGVGVREVTSYTYDPAVAFKWATEHNLALMLDEPAFKKIAKASPLVFVTETVTPQAIIAWELGTGGQDG